MPGDDDLLALAVEAAARERGQSTADVDHLEPRHIEQARQEFQAREARRRRRLQLPLGVGVAVGTALVALVLYDLGTPLPRVTRAGFTTADVADPTSPLAASFPRAQAAAGLTVLVVLEDLTPDVSYVLDAVWRGPAGDEIARCSASRQDTRDDELFLACRPALPPEPPLGAWTVDVLLSNPRLYQVEVPLPGSSTPGELTFTLTP